MPHSVPQPLSESPADIPSASPDFRTELAAQLAELVPEAIADGKIDARKLAELLGEDAADESERFGLFWPGKKRALRAAQAPTSATLKPDLAHSKDWDTTQNVFIEGDNLEVLKILQRHYHNKVKLIYIDPPYNTGKDFVYPDNFTEGLDTYLEWTRQVNEEGQKVSTNSESEGRFHSNWLNMMYPRLKLARNLLTDDGVIFVSIDDNEVANLRRVCDEVFGEANFIGQWNWFKSATPPNLSKKIKKNVEYVLAYERARSNKQYKGVRKFSASDDPITKPQNSAKELRFPAGKLEIGLPNQVFQPGIYGTDKYPYELLDTLDVLDGKNRNDVRFKSKFTWTQPKLDMELSLETKMRISSDRLVISYKKKDYGEEVPPNLIDWTVGVGTTESAGTKLTALMGGADVFDYPKPVELISYLTNFCISNGDIVLDFFAGSSTTAHAVMQLNAEDEGNRRFIMVQLPEPTSEDSQARKSGFATIADISRKRIELAGERIGKGDTGFRAYKLTDTNFAKWRVTSDVTPTQLEQHLLDLRDSADDAASQDDLLTELLLKLGHSLTETITTKTIKGLEVREVGDNRVLAYVDETTKPTLEQLRALVDAAPGKLILLEDAFHGDDELKTNLAQYAKTQGIELRTA